MEMQVSEKYVPKAPRTVRLTKVRFALWETDKQGVWEAQGIVNAQRRYKVAASHRGEAVRKIRGLALADGVDALFPGGKT